MGVYHPPSAPVLVALLLVARSRPPRRSPRRRPTTRAPTPRAIAALPEHPERDDGRGHDRGDRAALAVLCNAGSVWYRYVAATDGRLVLTLTAAGDLDATLDAYLQQRSQLTREDSDVTDAKGEASVSVPRARRPGLPRARRPARGLGGRHLQARLRRRRARGQPAGPAARAPRRVGHARPRPQARRRLLLPDARRHHVPHQLRRPRPARRRRRTTSRPAARPWTSTRPARATSPTTRCAASAATPTSSSRRGAGRAAATRCGSPRPPSSAGRSASTCRSPRPTPATPRRACR